MRDQESDRFRFARRSAMDLGAKSIIKRTATVPSSGRVQEVLIENGENLQVGDLVAQIEDCGEVIRPRMFRIAKIEPGVAGNRIRWFTLELQP